MRTTNYTEGYYAYTHADPDGQIFYVGKGKGRRGHMLLCRAPLHQKRINEIGRENVVITILPAPTSWEAACIERDLIAKLRAEGAPLCNTHGVLKRGRCPLLRLSEDEFQTFEALGGADWVRSQIAIASSRIAGQEKKENDHG
jgi:hypothetical protein